MLLGLGCEPSSAEHWLAYEFRITVAGERLTNVASAYSAVGLAAYADLHPSKSPEAGLSWR